MTAIGFTIFLLIIEIVAVQAQLPDGEAAAGKNINFYKTVQVEHNLLAW